HDIPILVVISLNGGWTADPNGDKPGRNLGYTRFDRMAETLGCYGEFVEEPGAIRPALERAQRQVDQGRVALVNIKTDHRARAGTLAFAQYSTCPPHVPRAGWGHEAPGGQRPVCLSRTAMAKQGPAP